MVVYAQLRIKPLAERPAHWRSAHRPATPPRPSASVRSAQATGDPGFALRAWPGAVDGRRDRRTSPNQDPPPTRAHLRDTSWPRRSPSGNFGQVETRDLRDGTSAQTAARAPAAQPPGPPCRPRRESLVRAAHLLAWECTLGGSRRADTSPPADQLTAWATRSATAQAAPRSSAHQDQERPCSTPPSTEPTSAGSQPLPSSQTRRSAH